MYCEKCGKYSGRYPLCKDCYYEAEESEEIETETEEQDTGEELVCPICGQPTSVYMGNARKDRLCREHGRMLKNGEITYYEKTNKYVEIKTGAILNNSNNKPSETKPVESANTTEVQEQNDIPEWLAESTKPSIIKPTNDSNEAEYPKCIVCENSTKNGWQYLCSECYFTCLEYTKEMNKNYSVYEYRNYYYNAKSNIYTLTGFENFIKPNCIKLIAIAKACGRYAYNNTLLDIVKQDVIEIISKKKEKDIIKETEENKVVEFNTNKNRGAIRGLDGHFLDSDKEKQIDDLLFTLAIPHAIHYNVPEITERTVSCDWYIPVLPKKGIYIEYFGMDTNDYIRNREEKIELYRKYKLKLIRIEKDETMDTQMLSNHIMQEYRKLKTEILTEEI